MFFQKPFRFHGRGAAGAGGGDGLAIAAVLNVAAGEDAGDVGEDEVAGLQIAVLVHIELPDEHLRVGLVANAQEHGAGGEVPDLAGLEVAQLEAGDLFLAGIADVFHHGIGEELDFLVLAGAFQHDLGRAEMLTAMNERDLGSKTGKEQGLFHG